MSFNVASLLEGIIILPTILVVPWHLDSLCPSHPRPPPHTSNLGALLIFDLSNTSPLNPLLSSPICQIGANTNVPLTSESIQPPFLAFASTTIASTRHIPRVWRCIVSSKLALLACSLIHNMGLQIG